MENDTQNTQPTSDVEQIKGDLKNLYEHVGVVVGKKTGEAKVKWNETKEILEAKRAVLEERATQLAKAGGEASSEMKSGFNAAFSELKKAFMEAKSKFDGE
jgi:ElaB/YqjD/DUF883 family membrane-anchored ribosome-binding protein